MNIKNAPRIGYVLAGVAVLFILMRMNIVILPGFSTGLSTWLGLFLLGAVLGLVGIGQHSNLTVLGKIFYFIVGFWGSLLLGWYIGRNIKAHTLGDAIQRGVTLARRIRIPRIHRHP